MVDRSNTNLAAVIWALLRSSFKSFCLSPVISYHHLANRMSIRMNIKMKKVFFVFFFVSSFFASSFRVRNEVEQTITFSKMLNDYFPQTFALFAATALISLFSK